MLLYKTELVERYGALSLTCVSVTVDIVVMHSVRLLTLRPLVQYATVSSLLISFPYNRVYSVYRSPSIVKVIKSKILRWGGHIARLEEGRTDFNILLGKHTGKRLLGTPRADGRTKLESMLKK